MTAFAEEFDRRKLTHVHVPWTHRMATDLRENQTAYLLLLPSMLVVRAAGGVSPDQHHLGRV